MVMLLTLIFLLHVCEIRFIDKVEKVSSDWLRPLVLDRTEIMFMLM